MPQLHSVPNAPTAIYLDFDGEGAFAPYDVDGDPATFSPTEPRGLAPEHVSAVVQQRQSRPNVGLGDRSRGRAQLRPRAPVRYVLPRHQAVNWGGPGRRRNGTPPGASGVVELSPVEFLDRLADLVQAHDDRALPQASPDELPAIDVHSP